MHRPLASVLAAMAVAGCGGGDGDGDAGPPAPTPAPTATATATATGAPDVAEFWPAPERYALELTYDADRYALAGRQTIALRNTGPEPLDAIWLRTWGNAFGSCTRRRVHVTVTAGATAGAERAGCTALELRLDAPLAPGARATVALRVAVVAPDGADRFGRFAGAAFFGNALPVLAVAGEDGWRLPPYTFAGESFFNLSAAWDLRLRLPAGARAATTGRTREAGDGMVRATAPAARDFMIVAGPLRETRRRAGGVVLRRWTLREPPGTSARALRTAARAVTRFARWFGSYDRAELDLVEGPRELGQGAGLGMEYPELVLTPAAAPVLEHEVAHQWWYAIVGNDEHAEPWLDESFASYAGRRLRRDGARPCRPPAERPGLTAGMGAFARAGGRAYVRTIYVGGACALETLERAWGAARFDALLREVVREHRDGVLTTRAFVAALRRRAPEGVDVDALLRRVGLARG